MNLPIRVRMTVWYVGLLAIIIAAVGTFLVVRLRADLTGSVDAGLRPASDQIAKDYGLEGVIEFSDSAGTVLKGERAAAQLLSADGRVIAAFGDPVARTPMVRAGDRATALAGDRLDVTRSLGPRRVDFRLTLRRVVRRGEPEVIVAGESLASVERSVRRAGWLLLLACPAALAATALGGWWLARRALRPVEQMAGTAAAIGPERLHDRVPEPRTRDEVAHLAHTLNTMLDRIERGVDEQRRLVADASHELRTPLAAMRAEIDVSLRNDELSDAAREVLASAREEVDHMARTVDDLLTLALADGGALELDARPTDLATLAQAVVDGMRPLAERRGVAVEHHGRPAGVMGDGERLRQAIRNIVENAIDHSPPGATVAITTSMADAAGRLMVEDSGSGVPAALRERIFDRFFRVDASRTRATGGSGLGLAITKEIAQAHGGRVWVEGRAPRGSAFMLEVPAAPPAVRAAERDGLQRAPAETPRPA
jgi:heavy metal sensor kinase